MPYTDFHYTPTGTGVISGKEVLEQTEDAINDLGGQISGDVQTAIDTANNALNTANTASSDAQNAVNTANTAYTTATNAQGTATSAQNTASNALTAAQNAQNDVNALGNRVTTAENNITQNTTDISGLTTRMGTAEGNITTLQNDVVTAQGTATSAQNTATMARQQAYVLRYSSTAITDNSTIAYSTLDNTDNIKADDKIIDVDGKIFSVVSVDSDNSTVTVGSALIDLALDANVMHLSGNETAAGIKTFSDDTYIKSLNFTNEVPSQSSSSSSIMPIITTITYGDSSPSVKARLNLRITADGTISFYPHENNQYSLGLTSRRWSSFFAFFANLCGVYLGNEASSNQRTNLYLLANRDTDGQSGAYVTRFRQNRAQGALQTGDLQMIGFDVLENEVRTNNVLSIQCTNWLNDVPQRVNIVSGALSYSYGNSARKALFNDLNPGSLSFPNLNNGLDISGYISSGSGHNEYTPLVDGWISVILKSTSGATAIFLHQGDFVNGFYGATSLPNETEPCAMAMLPVKGGSLVNIDTKGTNSYVYSAKFYPCLGNV